MEDDDQLRERFERVFHEHHAAVCAYAFRRADRATAQDAVSFAVRLHRARHRFRAELAAGGFEAATLDTMEPA